ncbi:MAG: AAA family ATPase, partial [Nanoarchaeota archaeon]
KFEDEIEIVNRYARYEREVKLKILLNKQSLQNLQILTREVPIANDLKKKAVEIVAATRQRKDLIEYGASPRASIGIILAAKAHALLNGRKYVSQKDLEAMAYPVLRHRLILNFKAEREGKTADDVISAILK